MNKGVTWGVGRDFQGECTPLAAGLRYWMPHLHGQVLQVLGYVNTSGTLGVGAAGLCGLRARRYKTGREQSLLLPVPPVVGFGHVLTSL